MYDSQPGSKQAWLIHSFTSQHKCVGRQELTRRVLRSIQIVILTVLLVNTMIALLASLACLMILFTSAHPVIYDLV